MREVPYVDSQRQVRRGTLISSLTMAGDVTRTPDTHVVYFDGEYPCGADGKPIHQISHQSGILNLGNGMLRLENSTVSGNTNGEPYSSTAAIENGGRYDGPTASARLVNVTIAGNPVYGLTNRGRISISNSIIAGNGLVADPENGVDQRDQNCLNEGSGTQFVQSGLLRGADSGNCATTLLVLNADTFVTVLQPLALNGWQSPTFALKPGSIAIDAAVGSCPSTDQRRVTRPRDGNGDHIAACDLGAYER
nr:DUF6791 domain-containing protein [uncultured Nevskia sp.]